MTLSIKICGLKTAESVDKAVELGATHVGFIFFPKSPRNILADDAAVLADRIRGRAKIVAVTVDATSDELDEITAILRPDILQFHGRETPERILTIKAVYGLSVMKVVSVQDADDLRRIEPYIGIADRFLIDAKAPKGSDLPGGNGVSFDWRLLETLGDDVDYMLSGGLNKDNVAAALSMTKATGVDLSSGVESAPGVKDLGMMEDFFESIRRAIALRSASGRIQ
jgi:phosphoribosylanthranilate isomerase